MGKKEVVREAFTSGAGVVANSVVIHINGVKQ